MVELHDVMHVDMYVCDDYSQRNTSRSTRYGTLKRRRLCATKLDLGLCFVCVSCVAITECASYHSLVDPCCGGYCTISSPSDARAMMYGLETGKHHPRLRQSTHTSLYWEVMTLRLWLMVGSTLSRVREEDGWLCNSQPSVRARRRSIDSNNSGLPPSLLLSGGLY